MVADHGRVANRIPKVREDANIKLACIATDPLGVSGRQILGALIRGEQDSAAMAELAKGRLRDKLPELEAALEGRVTEHHRFMLDTLMTQLVFLEDLRAQFEARIEGLMGPFQEAVDRLMTIPGVKTQVAQAIAAEVGVDVQPFPSAAHLASWAGVCPGNHESAGKRKSGKTAKGSRWLRSALTQAAWAASRAKDTYLCAQFRHIARRGGKKRAAVAVSHTLLVIAYHLLKERTIYRELGADFFDRLNPERMRRYFVKRLQRLGFEVSLAPATPVASVARRYFRSRLK